MRKLVTIEKILDIQPILDADVIEKAKVRGWWVVVKKGEFKIGDTCIYHEIDSFLPVNPTYDFLTKGNSPRKMLIDGKEITGIKLKTVKLRGQVSQGLILPVPENLVDLPLDTDVSEILGIIKYELPIPPELTEIIRGGFPGFLRKTDEERIQNCLEILENFKGEKFYVSSKLDGTSTTFYKKDSVLNVCSRNLELVLSEENKNTYWNLAFEMNIFDKLPNGFAIQGELVGEGIQKNPLKIKGHKFFIFNVFDINEQKFLDFQDFREFVLSRGWNTVPIINDNFILNHTLEEILLLAQNKSPLNPQVDQEGIVVRPLKEMTIEMAGQTSSRFSFKVISNKYLLKHDE